MVDCIVEGERLYLRSAAPSDARTICTWKKDPLLRKMALDEDTVSTAPIEKESITRAQDSNNELYIVIQLKNPDRPIGYIRINWMDAKKRSAWLRFGLGAERGKGYAREALSLLLPYLFSLGCHRVEAEVYDFNTPSLKLLQGLGFRREGTKRDAHHDSEGYHDVVVLGLVMYSEPFEGSQASPRSPFSR